MHVNLNRSSLSFMTDFKKRITNNLEDTISEATETLTGKDIYDALNQAINNQMAWHKKELKALQDLQFLVTGAPPRDLFD